MRSQTKAEQIKLYEADRQPRTWTNGLHQTDSYLKDIILQREVREAIPEAACSRLGFLPCLEQMLAGVIDLEFRHF